MKILSVGLSELWEMFVSVMRGLFKRVNFRSSTDGIMMFRSLRRFAMVVFLSVRLPRCESISVDWREE